jgi:hypothetical protein
MISICVFRTFLPVDGNFFTGFEKSRSSMSQGSVTIQFQDESFSIDHQQFTELSGLVVDPNQPVYQITSDVTLDSVREFIHFFTSRGPSFSSVNTVDLLLLSIELKVRTIRRRITTLIMSAGCDLLVSTINSLRKHHHDASKFEEYLSARLGLYINDPSLLNLSLETLVAVFHFPREASRQDYHKFFEFAVNNVRKVGSSASILFESVDFSLLTSDELDELTALPNLKWKYISAPIVRHLKSSDEDVNKGSLGCK